MYKHTQNSSKMSTWFFSWNALFRLPNTMDGKRYAKMLAFMEKHIAAAVFIHVLFFFLFRLRALSRSLSLSYQPYHFICSAYKRSRWLCLDDAKPFARNCNQFAWSHCDDEIYGLSPTLAAKRTPKKNVLTCKQMDDREKAHAQRLFNVWRWMVFGGISFYTMRQHSIH